MAEYLENLRRRIELVPKNGRGRRKYGASLRAEICELAINLHSDGMRITTIAKSLDIANSLLCEWLRKHGKKSPTREVVIEADQRYASTALSLRLANGAVVEGLSVDDIVHLLGMQK